jgi:hypothetical protein
MTRPTPISVAVAFAAVLASITAWAGDATQSTPSLSAKATAGSQTALTTEAKDATPAPDASDPDLLRYLDDRNELKAELAARMKDRGERPTPVAIERELAQLERLAAAQAAVDAVKAAGGTPFYHSVDLTDPVAVGRVLKTVRETSSRVDLLLHAAGVEISRTLPDKEPTEYDLVLDVKSDGWFSVRASATCRSARPSCSPRSPDVSATPARPTTAPPTTCSARSPAVSVRLGRQRGHWRSTGRHGAASGWRLAARSPRSWRWRGRGAPPEAGVAWIRRELGVHFFAGEVVVANDSLMTGTNHETGGLEIAAVDRWARVRWSATWSGQTSCTGWSSKRGSTPPRSPSWTTTASRDSSPAGCDGDRGFR